MLIATSNCFDPGGDLGHLLAWDGPSLLVFLPGSSPGRTKLMQIERDFLVLECLEQPAGVRCLMLDILSLLKVRFENESWPLLYMDRPADADFVKTQYELGRRHPGNLEASFSDGGELATLRLGEMIATSPVLRDVVSFMCENRIDDRRMVGMLGLCFPGDRA
jgi:hypothetical protein